MLKSTHTPRKSRSSSPHYLRAQTSSLKSLSSSPFMALIHKVGTTTGCHGMTSQKKATRRNWAGPPTGRSIGRVKALIGRSGYCSRAVQRVGALIQLLPVLDVCCCRTTEVCVCLIQTVPGSTSLQTDCSPRGRDAPPIEKRIARVRRFQTSRRIFLLHHHVSSPTTVP